MRVKIWYELMDNTLYFPNINLEWKRCIQFATNYIFPKSIIQDLFHGEEICNFSKQFKKILKKQEKKDLNIHSFTP
jgi:hypothetical protein